MMADANPDLPGLSLMSRQDLRMIVVIVLGATLLLIQLFVLGAPMGDDAPAHYGWSVQFIQALKDGAWYPRWLSNANWGHGSPAMLYYTPLPFYVTAASYLSVGSVLSAMTIACWLAFVASGLSMYWFSRFFLARNASLVAALFYMAAPYHLFDLYQRTALSEVWGFAWAPLFLGAVYRTALSRNPRSLAWMAVTLALLLFTHLPTALALSLVVPVYVLVLTRKPGGFARVAAGAALGIGLSAIFVLPMVREREYVRYDQVLKFKFQDSFLFNGVRENLNSDIFGSHYFQPHNFYSNGNWIAIGLLLLFGATTVVIGRRLWSRSPSRSDSILRALWAVTLVSLFMTTRWSRVIWERVPFVPEMQFPVRWLLVTCVGISVLVAAAIVALQEGDQPRRWRAIGLGTGLAFNLVLAGIAIARAPYDPAIIEKLPDQAEQANYQPIWWDQQRRPELERNRALVTRGQARIIRVDDSGIEQQYRIQADSESVLTFHPLYFPGWVAQVDGQSVPLGPGPAGHIQLPIRPGEHQVTLRFEDTRIRTIGKAISGLSLLFVLILLALGARAGAPQDRKESAVSMTRA
jgi:4-amino-4-deoxy-L-arabinose transferase-like glycosyltransferase